MTRAWRERIIIPTYGIGKPDKNPMFLENRVYQGSSGVVYPYPVIESVSDEKVDKEYEAVFLENEYLKIMILPELGGRIQRAYDKIAGRDFIYYNQVVKPALVGLTGPWISGGVEFNWPQHHRPSTFLPVDSSIEEHEDGSVTVWVGERERMFHQKSMAGMTLSPVKAYLEVRVKMYNPTFLPQTFLWWANPAVKVNDAYQSVFPQDVNAVFDHGKRAVSSFPVATGTYYKMDYSSGVDISNYKNIKVPTSYMAVNSKYDFEGGYENDTRCGMLHVADHRVSPGKKQWTWGNGDFGRAWDRNLTDEDGPYIELMAGVYTENQPDFSWIQPGEEKEFRQYFMPYRELGIVKNANKDLVVNVEDTGDGKASVKVFSTSARNVRIVLATDDGRGLLDEKCLMSPEKVYERSVGIDSCPVDQMRLELFSDEGRLLLSWHAESSGIKKIPDAAEAPPEPALTKTTEQLYLTGLHLEQYRHASWSPVDYYEEALRRDPLDVRNNNALGLWYLRRGRFAKSEPYFRTAVKVLCKRNPNPYEGEPFFNLGLAIKYQGRLDEAYDCFYKSTWNGAWQDAGFLACAQISAMQGRLEDALWECDRSIARNSRNHKARALKVALLRRLGRVSEAVGLARESLLLDVFDFPCMFELILCGEGDREEFIAMMRDSSANYQEIAVDYMEAGLWDEAVRLSDVAIGRKAAAPLLYYYKAFSQLHLGVEWMKTLKIAQIVKRDEFFPNRLIDIVVLKEAASRNEMDARAPYYLGNIFYDKRQWDEARTWWEMSSARNPLFPTVLRNLALGYCNKEKKTGKALEYMSRAFLLDGKDSRVFMELDQLRKLMGQNPFDRLKAFISHEELVEQRDDLVLEKATLLNLTGKFDEAIAMLESRKFHPWEGGEGKVPAQYRFASMELAKLAIASGDYKKAVSLLEGCLVYRENFGEGKLEGAVDNDLLYLLGLAHDRAEETGKARDCWMKATLGPSEPVAALYYNDAKPDRIFYQGLAFRSLGREDEARSRFHKLVNYGERHIYDEVKMDYFAVSLPDLQIWDRDLGEMNAIHCMYMLALGYEGLGRREDSEEMLSSLDSLNHDHQGAISLKSLVRLIL